MSPYSSPSAHESRASIHFQEQKLMSTPAQLAANQANSQLSTGPVSADGKQRSSLNALKTGLTGRTVLLPGEDKAAFESHLARFREFFEPATNDEAALVQRLAETRWRLDRCPTLESNLFALGQVEFAALFPDESPEVRLALIQAYTFRAYQKEFRNLNIQESRLQRSYDRDLAELREFQAARVALEEEAQLELDLAQAAALYLAHQSEGKPFQPAQFGFEFTTAEIEGFLQSQNASTRAA
jgi:hypothetical protein